MTVMRAVLPTAALIALLGVSAPFAQQTSVWWSEFHEDFDPGNGTMSTDVSTVAAAGLLQAFWLERVEVDDPADFADFHIGPVTSAAEGELCVRITSSDFAYSGVLRSETGRIGSSFEHRAVKSEHGGDLKERYRQNNFFLLAVVGDDCSARRETVLVPVSLSPEPDTLTLLLALRSGEAFVSLAAVETGEVLRFKCRDHNTNVSNIRCRIPSDRLASGKYRLEILLRRGGQEAKLSWFASFSGD